MTREQLYQTVYGNRGPVMPRPSLMGQSIGYGAPTSNASDWDMWRRDVTRNPSLQDATADDEALAWMQEQNRLEHDVLMRGNADRAKNRVDLLKRAQAQIRTNLFSAPTNDFERELQQTIQQHVNAGQRGFQLGYASDVANRKLAQQRLENRLKLQDAALDRARFTRDTNKDIRDFRAQRQDAAFRQLYQKGLLTQADKRLQLQQLENLTQGMNADGKMALEAVKDYGMDPEQAIQVFGIPEGSAADVLRAYGGLVSESERTAEEDDAAYAEYLNLAELENRRGKAPQAGSGKFLGVFGSGAPDPATFDRGQLLQYEADPATMLRLQREAARRGLRYNPKDGFTARSRSNRMPIGSPLSQMTSAQSVARLQSANLPVISSPDQAAKLPSGTVFQTPDGRTLRRP